MHMQFDFRATPQVGPRLYIGNEGLNIKLDRVTVVVNASALNTISGEVVWRKAGIAGFIYTSEPIKELPEGSFIRISTPNSTIRLHNIEILEEGDGTYVASGITIDVGST